MMVIVTLFLTVRANLLACMIINETLIGVTRIPVGNADIIPQNWNEDATLDPLGSARRGQEDVHVTTRPNI